MKYSKKFKRFYFMADYQVNRRVEYLIKDIYRTSPFAFSQKYGDKGGVKTSRIITNRNGVSSNMVDLICQAYPDVNRVWLLTGEGEPLHSSAPYQSIIANANGHAVQHNNLNIGQPVSTKSNDEERQVAILTPEIAKEPDVDIMGLVERNELETRAALPSLPKYDICYRNQSNCMAPWIMPGDQLALQFIAKDTPIFGGEVYALDYKQTGLLIRRVYEEEGNLLRLVAFNQDYSPVVIRKDDVFSYFRIVGQLRTFSSGRMV